MLAHAQDAPELEKLHRIGDVSRLTDTKPFVLRFWETEFPMLQPVKTPKGHRLYRQEDIDLIRAIKRLLYEEGFTIPGARRHLSEAMASREGLAPLLQSSTGGTRMSSAGIERGRRVLEGGDSVHESTAATAAASELPGMLPDSAVPYARVDSAVTHPDDLRQTLRAVGDELRAILTLLGTR